MCWSFAPNPDLEVKQYVNSDGNMLTFMLIYSETKTIAQLNIYSFSLTKLCTYMCSLWRQIFLSTHFITF